jgi:hypothetical protein
LPHRTPIAQRHGDRPDIDFLQRALVDNDIASDEAIGLLDVEVVVLQSADDRARLNAANIGGAEHPVQQGVLAEVLEHPAYLRDPRNVEDGPELHVVARAVRLLPVSLPYCSARLVSQVAARAIEEGNWVARWSLTSG